MECTNGEKRNIVLITIDDLRHDHCGFMGYTRNTTPFIDKLAKKGIYFKNAYSPSHNTPCSMKAIFTGRYLTVDTGFGMINQFRKNIIEEFKREKTLAQILTKHGFSTCAFTPSAYASSFFGFNKGFQKFNDLVFRDRKGHLQGVYRKIFSKFTTGSTFAFITRSFIDFVQGEGAFMQWEKYYDEIISWVDTAKEPFFLWVFPLDTHRPYLAPKKYRKWSKSYDMYVYNFYYNWKISKHRGRLQLSHNAKQKLINAYDDSIYYADNLVKRLWNDLKEYDPIFIIHADHGEAFGEHGFYEHQPFLYEEVIHVPLVISNIDSTGCIENSVSLIGLTPTILKLVGVKERFPSKEFITSQPEYIVSKSYEEGKKAAVILGKWKYIHGQKPNGELYNLHEDKLETKDLSNIDNKNIQLIKNYLKHIALSSIKQDTKRRIINRITKNKTAKG